MESFDAVLSTKVPATLDKPASTAVTIMPESTGTLDLSWSAAKYGDKIPATYTLVISRRGSEKRIEFPVATGARQVSLPLQELNKRLVTELEMEGDKPGKVAVTVEALPLADKGNPAALKSYKTTSAPLELTITPFFATVRPDLYFLVGNLSGREGEPGWKNDNNDHILFADDNNALAYHYYGYLKADAAFKIFPEASIGAWDNILGMKEGKLDMSGGDIKLPAGSAAGYYRITLTVNRGKLDPAQATLSFDPLRSQTSRHSTRSASSAPPVSTGTTTSSSSSPRPSHTSGSVKRSRSRRVSSSYVPMPLGPKAGVVRRRINSPQTSALSTVERIGR